MLAEHSPGRVGQLLLVTRSERGMNELLYCTGDICSSWVRISQSVESVPERISGLQIQFIVGTTVPQWISPRIAKHTTGCVPTSVCFNSTTKYNQ